MRGATAHVEEKQTYESYIDQEMGTVAMTIRETKPSLQAKQSRLRSLVLFRPSS
jgi:hypothetical protein